METYFERAALWKSGIMTVTFSISTLAAFIAAVVVLAITLKVLLYNVCGYILYIIFIKFNYIIPVTIHLTLRLPAPTPIACAPHRLSPRTHRHPVYFQPHTV